MDTFFVIILAVIGISIYGFIARNTAQAQKQKEYDEEAQKAQNRKEIRKNAYINAHFEVETEAFEEEKAKAIADCQKNIDDINEHLEIIGDTLPDIKSDLENCIYFDEQNTDLNPDEVSDEKYDKYITDRKYILELKTEIENIEYDLRELPKNISILEAEIKRIKELEFENG